MDRCVLIINDSKFEKRILKDLFEKINFRAIIANEFNAIDIFLDNKPDLVFVNYVMEETDGISLIKKIKFVDSDVKCVLSSCDSMDDIVGKTLEVDEFIKTPINLKDLVEKIIVLWE